MRISDIYKSGKFEVSIEIFPPKTVQGNTSLRNTLNRLSSYQPSFISCTYGAGGTTQQRTLQWCTEIQEDFSQTATAHFTCVGATKAELLNWLTAASEKGIKNIMALRGDPPTGESTFLQVEGGLRYANELVSLIRQHFPDTGIGVAGYPETHPEAESSAIDLVNLKRKVDAGANAIFTQLFYDNDKFLSFQEACDKLNINIPIIPGIMPITEFSRIQRITSMCGASIPEDLAAKLEAVQDDKLAQFEIGVGHAIKQCCALRAAGVKGIHLYVLNRSKACEEILQALDFTPTADFNE